MATPFAQAWVKLRKESGYQTPYEFYVRSGGRRILQVSFVSYWKMEKGRVLPRADRLAVLASLLRLPPGGPGLSELARAYLRTLLGSEQAYDWLMGALTLPARGGTPGPAQKALHRVLWEDSYRLSAAQNDAVLGDYAAYWSFRILVNDPAAWKAPELARRIKATGKEVFRALQVLKRARLVTRRPDGAYRSPLAGKHCRFLPQEALRQEARERIRGFQERMIKAQGSLVFHAYCMPRSEASQLAAIFPAVRDSVNSSHLYSVGRRTESSAQYLVEGKVYRLFPL